MTHRLLRWWGSRYQDVFWRPLAIIAWLALLVLVFLLEGCATAMPYTAQPGTYACVAVHWTPAERIKEHCTGSACASANQIWAVKPASFDDYAAVHALGHEFLHTLGGMHE